MFKLLRGKSGTKVTVGVLRRGEDNLIDFEITRDKIPIYSVDVSYMIDDETNQVEIIKGASSRGGGISILKSSQNKHIKKVVSWASVSDFFPFSCQLIYFLISCN
ncbi:hypothetical protein N9Y89_01745 [bacterium]|nr:hypothetical protein [bacterium]